MCIRVSDVGGFFDRSAGVPLLDIKVYLSADEEDEHADIKPEHSAYYGRKASVKQRKVFGEVYIQ